jgi:hypothetical protein
MVKSRAQQGVSKRGDEHPRLPPSFETVAFA